MRARLGVSHPTQTGTLCVGKADTVLANESVVSDEVRAIAVHVFARRLIEAGARPSSQSINIQSRVWRGLINHGEARAPFSAAALTPVLISCAEEEHGPLAP